MTIDPINAAIVYSPGNWAISAGQALSINAGAYFSTLFSGTALALNFSVTNMASPASEIYYRIDGYEAQSPWTRASVAATIDVTLPTDTAEYPYHLLEVCIKSTTQTANRWNTPSNTAVILTSLVIDAGASLMTPGVAPGGAVVFYGDSITEGIRTVNGSAPSDTDQNDAMQGWAYALRRLLGVEVGIVGFGSTGLTVGGSGSVPALPQSYPYIMQGVARTITAPKLIVLNEGTNDSTASSATVSSALTTVLNGLQADYPSTAIAVMRPFNGSQAAALQSGIAACNNPAMVHWIDTTNFFDAAYGSVDGLHPEGANDQAIIAPQVAAALYPILHPTSTTGGGSFASA